MVSLETLTRVKDPPVPPVEEGRLLTTTEVADRLRLSRMTVYKMLRTGELDHYKARSRYRVSEAQLATYLEGKDRRPQ